MGVDITTYRVRIGSFNTRRSKNNVNIDQDLIIKLWYIILVLAVLLIIGGVEVNPGPNNKGDQTMAGIDDKINKLTDMLYNHTIEMNAKIDNMNKYWNGMRTEVETLKKDIVHFKEKMQATELMERNFRNHNIIVFGLGEYQNESRCDTAYRILDLFASELHLNVNEQMVDNCYWLGRRRGNRPLLVRFTSVMIRDAILESAKMLRGTKIRIDRDYDFKTRMIRRELIKYMWEARRNGKSAFLVQDKLKINGRIYDLEFCQRNLNKEEKDKERVTRSSSHQMIGQGYRNRSRSRSQSPTIINLSQQEVQAGNYKQSGRVDQRTSPQTWKGDDGARGPRPSFRLGAMHELNERRELQSHDQGNDIEQNLETVSSPQGSIVRVNRNSMVNQGYYDLRSWARKKP